MTADTSAREALTLYALIESAPGCLPEAEPLFALGLAEARLFAHESLVELWRECEEGAEEERLEALGREAESLPAGGDAFYFNFCGSPRVLTVTPLDAEQEAEALRSDHAASCPEPVADRLMSEAERLGVRATWDDAYYRAEGLLSRLRGEAEAARS